MKIVKARNHEHLSKCAATIIASVMIEKKDAVLGLATGSSPIGTYKELIKMNEENLICFSEIKTFNLDEYIGLPKSHDQSYDYFMKDNLFNHVNIKLENTDIPNGICDDYEKECLEYERKIKLAGGIDIQLLGLGPNGHIGFNEPCNEFSPITHVEQLTESTIEANKRFFESVDNVPKRAITMGIGTIMKAKKILLVCSGNAKKDAFLKMTQGPVMPQCPASVLQYHPDVTIIYADIDI